MQKHTYSTGELGYDGLNGTKKNGPSYAKSVVYIWRILNMHRTGTKHMVRHMQKSVVQWSVISKFTCIYIIYFIIYFFTENTGQHSLFFFLWETGQLSLYSFSIRLTYLWEIFHINPHLQFNCFLFPDVFVFHLKLNEIVHQITKKEPISVWAA